MSAINVFKGLMLGTAVLLLLGGLPGCVQQDDHTVRFLGGAVTLRIPEEWDTDGASSDPLEFHLKHGDREIASLVAEAGESVAMRYPRSWDEEMEAAKGMNRHSMGDLESLLGTMQKDTYYFDEDERALTCLEETPEGLEKLHMRFYDNVGSAALSISISLKPSAMEALQDALVEIYENVHIDKEVDIHFDTDYSSDATSEVFVGMLDRYDALLKEYKVARKQMEQGVNGAGDKVLDTADRMDEWRDEWEERMDELGDKLSSSDLLYISKQYRKRMEEYRDIITGN